MQRKVFGLWRLKGGKGGRMVLGQERVEFSIIVVCLNAGERLRITVDSILGQSYGGYEILVKDGMSTDGSLDRLPEDARIRALRRKDRGIYDAMNQAVEEAKGRYIYFLNCGDVFFDGEALQRVKGHIRETEKEGKREEGASRYVFYGDIYERLTGQRVASNPAIDAFGCYRNVPCHQACFYGAGLMRDKGFDLRYRVRADYEHFLWCFFQGGAEMVYMPELVSNYEGGGFSETKANRKASAREHREIVGRYMSRGQVWKYRAIMALTLAPLRTWLAGNRLTARVYQWGKGLVYGRGGKCS